MTDYSREIDPSELSEERLDALTEYYGVGSGEEALEALGRDPVVEVGREDGRRPGSEAVISPCPLCGGKHRHKFGVDLEEGKLVETASDCPDTPLYWLAWYGRGTGEWRDDPRFRNEPKLD